jgi:hypothetical protein
MSRESARRVPRRSFSWSFPVLYTGVKAQNAEIRHVASSVLIWKSNEQVHSVNSHKVVSMVFRVIQPTDDKIAEDPLRQPSASPSPVPPVNPTTIIETRRLAARHTNIGSLASTPSPQLKSQIETTSLQARASTGSFPQPPISSSAS